MQRFTRAMLLCALSAWLHLAAWDVAADEGRQPAAELEEIRAVLQRYFAGHATGDPAHMRRAFLPTAHIEGIRNDRFMSWTLDEYCALFDGEPAADEARRVRTIDVIDVTGNAGMAKATLVHGKNVFTDYFVLLKSDGEWRIANKVYHGRPATPDD